MSEPGPNEERGRRLADDIVNYALYAPLGAALSLAEELPELVRKGRARFGGQVQLAQVIGRVAVDSARRRAKSFRPPTGAARSSEPEQPRQPRSEDEPFEGYAALGASDVLARLPGLSRPELIAARAYERAHRSRRTVLGRIEQLLASDDG